MILGIDVGGTHTDGVLVKKEITGSELQYNIKSTEKVITDHDNLEKSILKIIDKLTESINNKQIERVVLSTTLITNVIYEDKYDPVGLILIPGPGVNPEYFKYGEENYILDGYIDHRGNEVKSISKKEVINTLKEFKEKDIDKIAIVGKFSVRNPVQENKIKDIINAGNYNFKTVTLGHKLSGNLNFNRRIITAYYNTAVSSVHQNFINSIEKSLEKRNIKANMYLLKSDGGTIAVDKSRKIPIKTVNSGPAASIMGTMTLNNSNDTGVAIDIGGTTTDIGLFINGEPVFMPKGININGFPTLIRGLYSVSIPVGGDSEVYIKNEKINIGPQRRGAAAALGGPAPTPTDALLVLEKINKRESQSIDFDLKKSKSALISLKANTEYEKLTLQRFAEIIIERVSNKIKNTINNILENLRNKPVYTISELLDNPEIKPKFLIGIGGPASSIVEIIAEKLNYNPIIPAHSKVANALGVAFSHPTLETTVRADTARGKLNIVEAGIHRNIKDDYFDINKAEKLAKKWTIKRFKSEEYPIEIISRESFNVIRNFRTLGKIMEIKAQIKPGLIADLKGGNIIL